MAFSVMRPVQRNQPGETNMRTRFVLVFVGLLGLAGLESPQAGAYSGRRQFYSSWNYNQGSGYHYRRFYYRPIETSYSYSYHYVVHYSNRPRYLYYYNPVKRYYWGRYDVEAKGYSLLAEPDRKQCLDEIKEAAFPKPGAMPNLPGTTDGVAMDVPPNDLPETKKRSR
jgi:hypothetical protein